MDRKKVSFIVGFVILVITIVSITYASYVWQSSDMDVSFDVSDAYFYCESGIENSINSLTPVLDYRSGSVESFVVKNVGRSDTTFSISLNIKSIDDSLKDESLKYKIMLDSSGGSKNCASSSEEGCTTIAEGDFSEAIVGMNTLAETVEITNNSKNEFYLFIYIDGNMENDPVMQNSSMSYVLDVCEVVVFFDYNGGTGDRNFLRATSYYDSLPVPTKTNTVVNFDSNGGSVVNSEIISYTFEGWYKEDSYANKVLEGDEVTETTNHTLHAKWNMTDASGTSTTDGCITLPTPNRTGHSFGGWYKDSEFKVVAGTGGGVYCVSRETNPGTISLYAKWNANTYHLNYTMNGGSKATGTPTSAKYDASVTIGTPTKNFTITGNPNATGATISPAVVGNFSFDGWAGTINTDTALYGSSIDTITTNWTDGSIKVKDRYFKNLTPVNGGTVTMIANWQDLTLRLPTISNGNRRCNWNTAMDGSGTDYDSGGSYVVPATTTAVLLTLYAKCDKEAIVTFYNGDNILGTQNVPLDVDTPLNSWASLGGTVTGTDYGWSFAGWSTSASSTEVQYLDGASIVASDDITLYAIYQRTLTFYSGINKNIIDGTLVQYYNSKGKSISSVNAYAPSDITDWTSLGYRNDTVADTAEYLKTTPIAPVYLSSNNFYAVYSREFSATFYSGVNKESVVSSEIELLYYNTNTASLPVSTMVTAPQPLAIDSWTTLGWRIDATAGAAIYNTGASVSSSNSYYAVYSRTFSTTFYSGLNKEDAKTLTSASVYYNTNTESVPVSGVVNTPTPVSILEWNALGWRSDTTSGSAGYSVGGVASTNNIYYAVYSRTFTATFYSGMNKQDIQTQTSSIVYYNSNTELTPVSGNVTTPTPAAISGWTAVGWRTDTTAGSAGYNVGDIASSVNEYYAIYSKKFTATFYSGVNNDVTSVVETNDVYYNTNGASMPTSGNVTMPEPSEITNWSVLGWRTDTTAADASYSVGSLGSSNNTYYAIYVRTLSIIYDANGGAGTTNPTLSLIYLNSNQTTTSSQSVTLATNGFTKSGNDFSKWAVLSVDGVQWEEGAIYTPSFAYDSENFGVTMYAIWNPETYTITYDANGGSGAPTPQTKNYGVDLILSSVRPARSDYNFLGWSTSSTANTPTYAAGGTYSINASVTLYAVWGVSGFIEEVLMVNAISDKDIDFSIPSNTSGTNGVFYVESTKNDANPIYYYRGNVDNNLIFANYCWKIIRTTETGGLKLIYNGTPTGGTCNNTGTATQIGTIAFNSNYNSPAYVGYMYGTPYTYSSKSMSSDTTNYVYGNTVTYAGGTYTLSSTISNSSWSSIYNGGLNNNHYTCFTTGTTCTSVYYVYYTTSSMVYYITLTEGKTVGDALSEMLDYNTTSSAIKGNSTTEGTLDYWYYNNIEQTGYGGYVEDTVWCNDRSIDSLNGWDPNGGNTREFLYFSGKNRSTSTYEPSLICGREIDRFTVNESNGNGDLDYPIGLLTSDEIMLAGGKYSAGNKLFYLYSGGQYWSGSPYNFSDDDAYGFYINATGFLNESYVNNKFRGVRPSISLAAGFNISGGAGTTSSPYIVQ